MSDDSLNVATLVARLLGIAVIVLDDAGRVVNADARACRMLGAADADTVGRNWALLRQRVQFDVALALPGDTNSELGTDASTPSEPRLRAEVHSLAPDRQLVLVRDKRRIDEHDHIGLLATEALANRHVLSGLVHQAKGPLNNFYLRLALLQSMLARRGSADEVTARWSKHVETLQQEAQALLDSVEEIGRLAHPEDDARDEIDFTATVTDIARLLRHAATIHEATVDVSLPNTQTVVQGNAHNLSLALISLATCLIDSTKAKARVAMMLSRDNTAMQLTLHASPAMLPLELPDVMFKLRATDARFLAQSTARSIIEAHGGDIRIVADEAAAWGFAVSMPLAPASP